jgi:hypothetical protein
MRYSYKDTKREVQREDYHFHIDAPMDRKDFKVYIPHRKRSRIQPSGTPVAIDLTESDDESGSHEILEVVDSDDNDDEIEVLDGDPSKPPKTSAQEPLFLDNLDEGTMEGTSISDDDIIIIDG